MLAWRSLAWGLTLLAAGCAGFPRLDPASLPTAAQFPDALAVVLLDEDLVEFHPGPGGKPVADVTSTRRVRILRPGGEGEGRIAVQYSPVLYPLVDFAARTVSASGAEERYTRSDAHDVMAKPGFVLYSDSRALVLTPKLLAPGTVVESRAKVRLTELLITPVQQSLGGSLPTRLARLEVRWPRGWRVDHAVRVLDGLVAMPPQLFEDDKGTRAVWEARDVGAIRREVLGPDSGSVAPTVIAWLTAWTEDGVEKTAPGDPVAASSKAHALQRETADLTPELRRLASDVVKEATTPEERAHRLYDWVRDHVTYCAIEIGIGGFRPHPASDVHRLGYGDCKDKANYLHALLAAVEVPSRPAGVWHHDGLPRPVGPPTVAGNFNHEILVVDLPTGATIVDPTSRTVAWGRLPVGDQAADLLPFSPEGSPLLRTPESSPADNAFDGQYELAIDRAAGGGWRTAGQFTAVQSGGFDDSARTRLLRAPLGERGLVVASIIGLRGALVDGAVDAIEPSYRGEPLRARGAVRLEAALGGNGDALTLRPADFAERWVTPLPAGPRRTPVLLHFRSRRSQRFRLDLKSGLRVTQLPAATHLATRMGSFHLEWRLTDQRLVLERRLELVQPIVRPDDYGDLKAFFDAILVAEAQPVLLDGR